MELYADTGDINELRELEEMGLISGVTTNPTLLSKEGPDAMRTLRNLSALLPDYPIFAQVTVPDARGMIEQARIINTAGQHMVVKIPATNEGLKAIAALARENVATLATAILTSAQALVSAVAGAAYVAPYTGQNELIGFSGLETLREIAALLDTGGFNCEIVAASIDKPQDMVDVALAGAHIATLTYEQLIAPCEKAAPLTDYYIDRFMKDWNSADATFG